MMCFGEAAYNAKEPVLRERVRDRFFFIGRVYVGFGGWESGFVRFLCAVTNLSQIQKLMRFIGI